MGKAIEVNGLLGIPSKSSHYKAPTLQPLYQHHPKGVPTLDLPAPIRRSTNPYKFCSIDCKEYQPLILSTNSRMMDKDLLL